MERTRHLLRDAPTSHLLMSGLEGLRSSLKELQRHALTRQVPPEERLFAFSRELFMHTDGHRDVFRAMVGDQTVGLLTAAVR